VKIVDKIKEVYGRQTFVRSTEKWSFHRFLVFFFSIKGQKRILKFCWKVLRYFWRMIFGGSEIDDQTYARWRKKNEPTARQKTALMEEVNNAGYQPLISIIIPVYKPDLKYLKDAVRSVQQQLYENWELCLVDDHSEDDTLDNFLRECAEQDKRIKTEIREENGHIAVCSNSALALTSGEFVGFMDQDDLLHETALAYVLKELNNHRDTDILYTDEDKVSQKGKHIHPHFKPDWSPDNFLSRNYIGHFTVIRKTLLDEIGGFREGYHGSQDYDLLLRATEKTANIRHIPKILYHWRMHEQSVALNEGAKNYAYDHGQAALNDAFERRGIKAKAKLIEGLPGIYTVDYELSHSPLVSVIIPTKDNAEVLSTCLYSLFERTSYHNFEVLLLDNNSTQKELFELTDQYVEKYPGRFRVVTCRYPFNFSKLMNEGVAKSKGDYILFLNNDTEVLQNNWMDEMLKHAQRPEVGAVGVKLLFPNDTIQHGGVVIGMGGVAGHTFIGKEKDDPGYFYYLRTVSNYSAVTAACLMVRKKLYHEVNGFDENLAVEYNDVDFCLKLIEAGYYNVFLSEVVLYHYESLSRGHPHATRESYKRHLTEVAYFRKRWQYFIDEDPFYNINLSRISTHFEPNVIG